MDVYTKIQRDEYRPVRILILPGTSDEERRSIMRMNREAEAAVQQMFRADLEEDFEIKHWSANLRNQVWFLSSEGKSGDGQMAIYDAYSEYVVLTKMAYTEGKEASR